MTRDQKRAQHAYQRVQAVPDNERKDYKILVNDLGTNILRSGLAVAIATVEREIGRNRAAAKRLLDDLGRAGIPGLENKTHTDLWDTVRDLDLDSYLLASRETLRVVTWLKRAVQATIPDQQPGDNHA